MIVKEREFVISPLQGRRLATTDLAEACNRECGADEELIRFVVTKSNTHVWECEIAIVEGVEHEGLFQPLFAFRRRCTNATNKFCAAFLVPTGIGAEIGGHAGDATAAARLIANSCDHLILHPNVVNGSDINEMPNNALYVEGSILTRLLMGTIGLQPIKSNRILAIIDDHPDSHFTDAAINTVNAGRATYGLDCLEVIKINPPIRLWGAKYTKSGRAVGEVRGLANLFSLIAERKDCIDAIAISSVISFPVDYHTEYFKSEGDMVNPWGGVEAMLTHTVSTLFDLPSAHAPMFESREIENLETGIVEPRMAAEAISVSFFQCALKGLHTSPKIVTDQSAFGKWGILSAEDVSCLIIPDGCLGLPTLAALEQGIPVIAVRENRNLMKNDLSQLPWQKNQFFLAENYLEAAGIVGALKAGITIDSVRRPISATEISTSTNHGYSTAADQRNTVKPISEALRLSGYTKK